LEAHSHIALTATELVALAPVGALALLNLVLAFVDDKQIDSPYDAGTATYSVESAAKFYQSKPLFVIKRLAKLASITSGLTTELLFDWRLGNLERNEKERAKEALRLSTMMGPTYVLARPPARFLPRP